MLPPLPPPRNVSVAEVLITEPTAENINTRLANIGVAVVPLIFTDKQKKDALNQTLFYHMQMLYLMLNIKLKT